MLQFLLQIVLNLICNDAHLGRHLILNTKIIHLLPAVAKISVLLPIIKPGPQNTVKVHDATTHQ